MGSLLSLTVALCVISICWWVGTVISILTDSDCREFITYRKFKKLFDEIDWDLKSHNDDCNVLIKKQTLARDYEIKYKMFIGGAQYIYNQKHMIPFTVIDLILINRCIHKKIKEIKPVSKKKKLFIW